MFSSVDRVKIVQKLESVSFDMLILNQDYKAINIAFAAAFSGIKTALISEKDFISNEDIVSENKSLNKLNLRNVFQFYKKLKEKKIIYKYAAHTVSPAKSFLPVSCCGLIISKILSFLEIINNETKETRHKIINKKEIRKLFPNSSAKKGVLFLDYNINRLRFYIEKLKTAVENGVLALNYCDINVTDGFNKKVTVTDNISNKQFQIKANVVIDKNNLNNYFPGKAIDKEIKISGSKFDFSPASIKIIEYADRKYDEAKQTGISVEYFNRLFKNYGTNIEEITNKAYDYYNQTKNCNFSWLKAEIYYSINHEMTTNLSDFFFRRTGNFKYDNNFPEKLEKISEITAELSNWDKLKQETEKQAVKDSLKFILKCQQ